MLGGCWLLRANRRWGMAPTGEATNGATVSNQCNVSVRFSKIQPSPHVPSHAFACRFCRGRGGAGLRRGDVDPRRTLSRAALRADDRCPARALASGQLLWRGAARRRRGVEQTGAERSGSVRRCGAVQRDAAGCDAMRCDAMRCDAMRCDAELRDAVQALCMHYRAHAHGRCFACCRLSSEGLGVLMLAPE